MARPKPQRLNPDADLPARVNGAEQNAANGAKQNAANGAKPNGSKLNGAKPNGSARPGASGNPAKRAASATRGPAAAPAPSGVRAWIAGARLRTLPLAIAPVALGTGAGIVALPERGMWHPLHAVLALVVALALQIGVNYANDYSDGVRGTDEFRVGPARLTGSGEAKPRTVLIVALSFFVVAMLAGLALTILTGHWWFLAVGAAAVVAAWFYTGGKHPYGYYGLGELFVFVFFGIVATAGSAFVQADTVNFEAWAGGAGIGLIACAVLMVNNLRDIEPDRAAGKRTLAVLVGPTAGRVLYTVFLLLPFALVVFFALLYPLAWLVLFGLLAALPAALITITAKTARELILALQLTSVVALVYGIGLGAAFVF